MAELTRTAVMLATPLLGLGLLTGCTSADDSESASATASAPAAPTQTVSASQFTAAEEGADQFFSLLLREDRDGLEEFLLPAFQLARADGSTAGKTAYLADPADVGAYRLEDFFVTSSGDALVARYTVTATERIDSQLYTTDPRQRLSVFVQDGAGVRMLAHANLNTPDNPNTPSALPDPGTDSALSASQAADLAIAEETQNAFFTALVDGDGQALESLLSPAFQLVRADGSAATREQYLADPAQIESFELSDFVTTREGEFIVASFTGTTAEVIDGQTYADSPAPRFAVMQEIDGQWQIIAQVNFNIPAS